MTEVKKDKITKKSIKIRRPHPTGAFRLGTHVITPKMTSYDLTDKEVAELENKGCKYWLITKEELAELAKLAAPKKAAPAKEK